ncbi:MAG: 1-acyl-sn-glycerol-3-phosphate acyltransferase [Rickettsiaceae bacterium]|jgi:1-acyl-sn-glycerol-3-phosphate acyltransferase|nr:1-acyl-sn-glycerol-3-phosphate acyltransferase [Rickettsiaceae bacterium]
MIFIRSLIFNIYFPLWTLLLSATAAPLLLAPPRIASRVGPIWANGIIFGLRYICNIRYEISGHEHLPAEPFVIAAKHQSAWDTAIFLKLLNGPAYILKKELLNIPMFGRYLVAMDMIPVDRSGGSSAIKKLQKDVNDRLAKKQSVVIFPEGTRTAPGEKRTYQPGIAFIYMDLDSGIPVVPVALNSGLYWGRESFLKHPGTIRMQYLPPIKPGLNRKDFMVALENAVENGSAGLK